MFRLNSLVPELSVSDINKSLNFYLNILSFKLEYQRPEDKFAMLSLNDCQIMIEEINGYWQTGELSYPFGRGINFQITVSAINAKTLEVKFNKAVDFAAADYSVTKGSVKSNIANVVISENKTSAQIE
ncbi:VOC family protein [Peribacillus simplex]